MSVVSTTALSSAPPHKLPNPTPATVQLRRGDTACADTPNGDRVCITPADPMSLINGLAPKIATGAMRSSPPVVLSPMVPILELRDVTENMGDKSAKKPGNDAADVAATSAALHHSLSELRRSLPTLEEVQDALVRKDQGCVIAEKAHVEMIERLRQLGATLDGLDQLADDLETHERRAGTSDDNRAEIIQAFFKDLTPLLSTIAPKVAEFIEAEHPLEQGVRNGLSQKLRLFCDWADSSKALLQDPAFQAKLEALGEKPRSTFMKILFIALVALGSVLLLIAILDKLLGDQSFFGTLCGGYLGFARTLVDSDFYKQQMDDAKMTTLSSIMTSVVTAGAGIGASSAPSSKATS